jgi:hypothetical protein
LLEEFDVNIHTGYVVNHHSHHEALLVLQGFCYQKINLPLPKNPDMIVMGMGPCKEAFPCSLSVTEAACRKLGVLCFEQIEDMD